MQLCGLITAPAIGSLVDKIGPRSVAIVGLCGHALMYCALAFNNGSRTLWLVSFAGLAVCAAGTLPITWTTVVNSWFIANRGLAIGLTMAGTGLAALLAPPYVEFLLQHYGWREAYIGLGGTALAVSLPVVWRLFQLRPPAVERNDSNEARRMQGWGLSRPQALKSYRFWALGFALLIVTLALIGIIPNFVPMLVDAGMSPQRAAQIASSMGIAVIIGRLLAGALVDRIWAPGVAALFFLLPLGAMLILAYLPLTPAAAVLVAICFGLAAGAELDLLAFLTSRYFGVRHYGAVFGGVYAFFTMGSGLAPLLYARSFDLLGSYRPLLPLAAGAVGIAILLLLSLGKYPCAVSVAAGSPSRARRDP